MYHFVYQDPRPQRVAEGRRKLLHDSDARSHAARVSHPKSMRKHAPSKLDTRPTAMLHWVNMVRTTESDGRTLHDRPIAQHEVPSWRLVKKKMKLKQAPYQNTFTQSRQFRSQSDVSPFSMLDQTIDPFDSFPKHILPKHVERSVDFSEFVLVYELLR